MKLKGWVKVYVVNGNKVKGRVRLINSILKLRDYFIVKCNLFWRYIGGEFICIRVGFWYILIKFLNCKKYFIEM